MSLWMGWTLWSQPAAPSCCCSQALTVSCSCEPQLCSCTPSDQDRALSLAPLPALVLSSATALPQGVACATGPAADAYRSPRLAAAPSPGQRPRAPPTFVLA